MTSLSPINHALLGTLQNPNGLDERVCFIPDERVIDILTPTLPRGVATVVAQYAVHIHNDFIFGPEHWIHFWGAIPVSLPSTEELRMRVRASGRESENPVEQMSAEECANFVGELGKEEHPEPPRELFECLSKPVRRGGKQAGFTCAVTYIPEYVRKEDRVMAVTFRTLALELGPNPRNGHAARFHDAAFALGSFTSKPEEFARNGADVTQPSCYFVMEQECAPNTKGERPSVAIAQIGCEDGNWQVPDARNFLASVFSRRAWKGELPFGMAPAIYTYVSECCLGVNCFFMYFGNFSEVHGLEANFSYFNAGSEERGAAGSRKFKPKVQLLT